MDFDDIIEGKNVLTNLLNALKFILYNDYNDLTDETKELWSSIRTDIINILSGLFASLSYNPDLAEKLILDFIKDIKNKKSEVIDNIKKELGLE